MTFADELADILPADLPNRAEVVQKAALHLDLIVEANRHFNLTRITNPREAAIKHVLDSVMPWHLFKEANHIVDAGTGAGFPGIPLALVLPNIRFTLSESIGKKANFVESAVKAIGISNIRVARVRAEELLQTTRVDLVTARAVAPISRAAVLFAQALKNSARALLYKGPDAEAEIRDAQPELRKMRLTATVVEAYELPESAGSRTIVQLKRL
jgi:16S rRNA (guanine527-N7)-methyltransferase